ncbi:uncharacterized protein METZ01_LOCUS88655, partial [marine metagenome]
YLVVLLLALYFFLQIELNIITSKMVDYNGVSKF